MARLVGEAHHLVLDRRAIAWTDPLDAPCIHRRAMDVGANQLVRAFVGVGDVAVDLLQAREARAIGGRRKRRGARVTTIGLKRLPTNGAARKTRRRPRLQTTEHQPKASEIPADASGRAFADAPARALAVTCVHHRAQEGARRHHHRAGTNLTPIREPHPQHAASIQQQPLRRAFHQLDPRAAHRLGRRLTVLVPITLATRPPHRRALAPIEHLELDPRLIRQAPHGPSERIDLTDDLALAEPADGGVAAHLAEFVEAEGDEGDGAAEAAGGEGGFEAGVATADDGDVGGVRDRGAHGILAPTIVHDL